MPTPRCEWGRCEHPAVLQVLVGDGARCARRQGAYCLPHAVIRRRSVAGRTGEPVWFGPVPPPHRPLRLVGTGAGDRPLHRHVWGRPRER